MVLLIQGRAIDAAQRQLRRRRQWLRTGKRYGLSETWLLPVRNHLSRRKARSQRPIKEKKHHESD
jgi:hypothetical protein